MTTTTDEYDVTTPWGDRITLSREERHAITYLVEVMDGEAARQSDIIHFTDVPSSSGTRLRRRLEDKDLVETIVLKGETPDHIADPKGWIPTDKAHELASSVTLEPDQLALAQRVALV